MRNFIERVAVYGYFKCTRKGGQGQGTSCAGAPHHNCGFVLHDQTHSKIIRVKNLRRTSKY